MGGLRCGSMEASGRLKRARAYLKSRGVGCDRRAFSMEVVTWAKRCLASV